MSTPAEDESWRSAAAGGAGRGCLLGCAGFLLLALGLDVNARDAGLPVTAPPRRQARQLQSGAGERGGRSRPSFRGCCSKMFSTLESVKNCSSPGDDFRTGFRF